MRVTYYVAMSLDGCIAKPDGDVAWLDEVDIDLEQTGYEEFFATVDGLIMGRSTYEQIAGFGEWPYGDLPVWVVAGSEVASVEGACVQPRLGLTESVAAAAGAGLEHLWVVGGGQLAAGLLDAGLLTHVSVAPLPVILGDGIRLTGVLEKLVDLRLTAVTSRPNGLAQLDYEVVADE